MKFNIGDKFYTFERGDGFLKATEYQIHQIMLSANDVRYRECDSRWFDEKECLTKEEVIIKINEEIKRLENLKK